MAYKKQGVIGRSAGQRVPPLINVIKSTLRNYPDGSQILKELIQNADDASATEVHFLLDETQHGTEYLIHSHVAKYQGPALYAWNNAVFDSDDWEGIQTISMSHKENKLLKVGRFALGFISVYHVTDFPCILSNDSVLLLDPHMIIDRTGGLMIGLDEFTSGTTEPNVRNHVDCFNGYFGYDGSDSYEGTIFRFPLRSGTYTTSLPNNIYDSQKVLESLFEPFKQEVENCLLFMKNVCDIRVSVKDTSGEICLLYSASVSDYRENLEIHRQEMSEFIQFDKKYLKSSKIFISIFPICLVSRYTSKTNLWIVINILGLTDRPIRAIYDKLSDSYLPWVAIALPLPQTTNSVSCLEYETCWSDEFNNILEVFDFIDSYLPTIYLSNQLIEFTGSVFCFLPIPDSSKLPFHVQGYFALSTNRRSIKWPRYDDVSDEAKWNKQLVQSLSTICYASLVHLSVSKFQCEGHSSFIYSLWACLPPTTLSEGDKLQHVLHSGTMSLLQDNPLVCQTSDMNWCILGSVYFLPSPFRKATIPHESVCNELLTTLCQPVVQVPDCVADVLDHYKFLKSKLDIVSPRMIRQFLKSDNENEDMINFLLDKDIVISLLEVILSDLDPKSTDTSILSDIPLIPMCGTEKPRKFGASTVYICNKPNEIIRLFPGLQNTFIEPKLPPKLYTFLLKLSRSGKLNIKDVSDIQRSPNIFYSLLSASMKSQFDIQSIVKWKPGALKQPNRVWIKHVWEIINEENELLNILKQHELPIFPKHNVSSADEIHLLPLSTKPLPFMKMSDRNYSNIEEMLVQSGCQLCYKNTFISNYNTFVKPALPKGLFPILRIANIKQNFMRKLDTADNTVRSSIINIVLKSDFLIENDIKLAKSFPIFVSFSNTWITIDKFRQYILPHHSIPIAISIYPSNFLKPVNKDNISLCAKFDIHPLSLEDTLLQHILPLVMGRGKDFPSQRNSLTIWLLEHLNRNMNRNTFDTLSTAKWLCDSSTPNRTQSQLYSPADFYDPQDKHIRRLLCSEMVGIFPNVVYEEHYDTLRLLGMCSCRNISHQHVSNLVKMTLHDVPIKYNLNWLLSLSYVISIHFEIVKNNQLLWNKLRQSKIILPSTNLQCVSYPTSLRFSTLPKTLCKPPEVILCSERDSSLIAGVAPVLVEESCKADKYKEIYRYMGMQCIISLELVCKQLELIITAVTNSGSNKIGRDVITLINSIYTYFGQQLTLNPDILRNIQFPQNCIFVQDVGFLTSEKCVLSCDGAVFPYIISLDKYYTISDENISAFFNFLKVDSYLSIVKCQLILNQLHNINLSVGQANLALSVIQYSHVLVSQHSQIATEYYILTQDLKISLAKLCVFNDLTWLNRSRIQTSKHILVHANISNQIASDFGCLPVSIVLAPTADISYSPAVGCGQSEDIIDRLKGILKGYRMPMDVFNELIQNSDDAGAHTVKILFDYTKHPSSSVLDKAVGDIHGPALYFFNDSKFTERDFESILKLSSGNKLNRTDTIGRFGIGFNAVYNLTDCPSFVSDKYVQIFDPLKKYLGPFCQQSGVRFCFADGSDKETYQDQFRVYDGLFDCNIFENIPYKYTLFRLPFRQTISKLCHQVFLLDNIVALQDLLKQEIPQTLIFLQNVTCIEVYKRSSAAVGIEQLMKVSKNEYNTTKFIQINQKYFAKYLQLTARPEIISSSDTVTIKIESQTEKSKQDFLVSYASGAESCFNVLQKIKNSSTNISFLPICGIAIPLHHPDYACHIYTFLPLPIRSPLPFSINGYFSLSDSRKNLSDALTNKGHYLDLPTEWNLALINDALPNALICALVRLAKSSSSHSNNFLTSLWSTTASTEFLWRPFPEHLANRIVNSSACIFSCVQTPTIWLSFKDISFLFLEYNLTNNFDFIMCIYTLSLERGINFANVPYSFFSTQVYICFSPEKTFNLKRIVEFIISPSLHKLTLDQIITIMTTLLPLCIHEDKQWLFSWISQTECLPCGFGSDHYKLNFPRRVVLSDTKVSRLYRTSEMRHPVPEIRKTFAVSNDNTSIVLQRLKVISHSLPESEIIERCEITKILPIELAVQHSNFLIEYLSTEDKNKMNSVYNSIKSIPFIPTHEDEITQILSNQIPPLVAPTQCYSYLDRHLVTPICMSASYEVKETSKVLNLLSSPPLKVVLQVLDTLVKQVDSFRGNLVIDDKITCLYQYLSLFESTFSELKLKPWVWEPETRKFYSTEQVIISPKLMSISSNTYLISFPNKELLKNENFKQFLLKVGMKFNLGDEAIVSCLRRIRNDFNSCPIDTNLIDLLIILIDSIHDHEVCSRAVFLPSQVNILHHPSELFINSSPHLQKYLSEDQLSRCLHRQVNIHSAYKLGARPSEEFFCTNNDSDFGLEEDITDRIKGLIREMPIDSVFKELIQNADDAEATEMVFILDSQDYSSHNDSLVSELPDWKYLHSHPSLNVYNNRGFSDEDIKGIQNLSVGGKTGSRNTIGRFGLGFNSVYHITDAPTFLTTCSGKLNFEFCCFDPFLKYTLNPLVPRHKRGLRRGIPFQHSDKFVDQFFPLKYDHLRSNDVMNKSLGNIWNNEEFTMFRFPLDISESQVDNSKFKDSFPYQKEKTRMHCSLENIERELMKMIKENPDILLFLNNLCKLTVLRIDVDKRVTLLSSLYIKPHTPSLRVPEWFPLNTQVRIQRKDVFDRNEQIMNWLIYSVPEIPIEEYVCKVPSLKEYLQYYYNEKLSGYGAVAVRICHPEKRSHFSKLFTFLPVGSKTNFPIHINAPLILDSSRQNVHYRLSEWEDKWHSSIIRLIIVPLYTMLLMDLKDPKNGMSSSVAEKVYFNWFYSLFPSSVNSDKQFLSEVSSTLFDFICKYNGPFLLADNLDESLSRIWYQLKGNNCGIFKPSQFFESPFNPQIDQLTRSRMFANHQAKEADIRYSLIRIKFPLTFAPRSLLTLFKGTELTPKVLLSYIQSNERCVFKENTPLMINNLESMVIEFHHLQTMLEYILADDTSYLSGCTIPLRIDLNDNLTSFGTKHPSYLPTFSLLLPHRGEDFISSRYNGKVVGQLLHIHFVKELDCEYLAQHLKVNDVTLCLQFWKYILYINLSHDGLAKFNKHQLVPVNSKSQVFYYPVSNLKYIVTSSLQRTDSILFHTLVTLECPQLHLDLFTSLEITSTNRDFLTEMQSFLDTVAISDVRPCDTILGSIELSTRSSAELQPPQADKLFHIFSELKLSTLSRGQLLKLSSLRIFQSTSSVYFSLEQLTICFVNTHDIPLCTGLVDILCQNHKLIIFKSTNKCFLKELCQFMNKEFISISDLFSKYIFKYLSTLPLQEQKYTVHFIAGRFAENKHEFIPKLIENLKETNFISVGKEFHRICEFYSTELEFIREFLPNYSLPVSWSEENLRPFFVKLGLRTSVSLNDILLVADQFSCSLLQQKTLPILLKEFAKILKTINFEEVTQTDRDLLCLIGELRFLPVWNRPNIGNVNSSKKIRKFSEAQLYENQNCCCTSSWIHTFPFCFPVASYNFLNIKEKPDPQLVIKHLNTISSQLFKLYDHTNVPDEFQKFFTSSYAYFESLLTSVDVYLESFQNVRCIFWQNELFLPINMLFTTREELKPFIRQLPPELSSQFKNFFKCIGVRETADYTHFSYVLSEINQSLKKGRIIAGSCYEKQCNVVFGLLIHELRSCNPELDLNFFLVLTNQSQLLLCSQVVYSDNPSLLSRVKRAGININILSHLEPDINKSCAPPDCLQMARLSDVISEEVDQKVFSDYILPKTDLASYSEDRIKHPFFYRILRRLYYHLTKRDLNELRFNKQTRSFNYKDKGDSIQSLLLNLKVISVSRIDLIIQDKPLKNACDCYFCVKDSKILMSADPGIVIFEDLAFALNTYLGGIFTEISCLNICFMIRDFNEIMNKLDEYNIDRDNFGELEAEATPNNTHPHTGTSLSHTSSVFHPTRPRPEGVSIGEPDPSAARLSLNTAQCHLFAAEHLITQIPSINRIYPSQACFLTFEALINLFQAILHFRGSKNRLTTERNLRVYLNFIYQLFPKNTEFCKKIDMLACPIMEYDFDTRYPSPSLIPCLGCNIPHQLYTMDQAIEAIDAVRQIMEMVTNMLSQMKDMLLSENDEMFDNNSTLSAPQLIDRTFCIDMTLGLRKVVLQPDNEEFATLLRRFTLSMPRYKILQITKIYNPKSWSAFEQKVKDVNNIFPNICLKIRLLFHGSSETDLKEIIDKGFDKKYSSGGLWGRGIYFAAKSSYAHRYHCKLPEDEYCIFAAFVLIGYPIELPEERNLSGPPRMPNRQCNYHSVQGKRDGEVIYIVYEDSMTYPAYLIRYETHD